MSSSRKKQQRILVLAPGFDGTKGGIQRYSHGLFHSLRRISRRQKNHRLMIRKLSLDSSDSGSKYRFVFLLVRQLLTFSPDLIIVTHAHLAKPLIYLRPLFRFRFVICCHGVEVWKPNRKPIRNLLSRANQLWSVSRFTSGKMTEGDGNNRDSSTSLKNRIRQLPNQIQRSRFKKRTDRKQTHKSYKIPDDSFIFLTVNRMIRSESFHPYESFLPAFEIIAKEKKNVHWICVGAGNDLKRFQRTVSNSPASDRITVPGFISDADLAVLYEASDMFVMPSKLEGFGIVYLEALANGLFCMAGDGDGAAEVLAHDLFGFVTDPDDPGLMAERIQRIMDLPDLFSDNMRDSRRKKVFQLYGNKPFGKKLLRLLRENISLDPAGK